MGRQDDYHLRASTIAEIDSATENLSLPARDLWAAMRHIALDWARQECDIPEPSRLSPNEEYVDLGLVSLASGCPLERENGHLYGRVSEGVAYLYVVIGDTEVRRLATPIYFQPRVVQTYGAMRDGREWCFELDAARRRRIEERLGATLTSQP